ncbi:hypothetical protein [Herbiconiux sp. A18JL235]|uniref:Uncharacterized protein n=1 Tax=Herbiconiux sp. A18JL235 TaxID=3152363 RepID=A0AB39BEW5_9MICO
MGRKALAVTLGVTGVVATASVWGVARRSRRPHDDGHRWNVVTIARPPSEVVQEHSLPEPLAVLHDVIDVTWSAAPGDRGTELRARPRAEVFQKDPRDIRRAVREALRETKQLLEVGHLMTLDPKPEGARPSTPAGLVVDLVTRRSPEEGVL